MHTRSFSESDINQSYMILHYFDTLADRCVIENSNDVTDDDAGVFLKDM